MNQSHWEHIGYALLMQLGVGFATGDWWAGAALAIGFFAGREHAQAEYRITRGGPVSGLRPWEGFRIWTWNKDAILDLVCPTVVVLVLAYVVD